MVIFRGQFHPVSTWLPWLQNPSNSQWHHNPLVLVSSFQGDDFELRGHGLCCEHRHEEILEGATKCKHIKHGYAYIYIHIILIQKYMIYHNTAISIYNFLWTQGLLHPHLPAKTQSDMPPSESISGSITTFDHLLIGDSKNRVPQNGWLYWKEPIKMDDLGGKPTMFGNILTYITVQHTKTQPFGTSSLAEVPFCFLWAWLGHPLRHPSHNPIQHTGFPKRKALLVFLIRWPTAWGVGFFNNNCCPWRFLKVHYTNKNTVNEWKL